MQYTYEIAAYTRQLLDDPNLVFFPDATLAQFLAQAEREYRNLAPAEVFSVVYQPAALTGALSVNLNGSLFGVQTVVPAPQRCQRILRVSLVTPGGQLLSVFDPASSYESLAQVPSSWVASNNPYPVRWWLEARSLLFSVPVTGTIRIQYLPDSATTWTATTMQPPVPPATAVYVDDLIQFHDVIALLAAQQYAVKDGARNPKLDERLALRSQDMAAFFAQTRSGQGSRYIREDGW